MIGRKALLDCDIASDHPPWVQYSKKKYMVTENIEGNDITCRYWHDDAQKGTDNNQSYLSWMVLLIFSAYYKTLESKQFLLISSLVRDVLMPLHVLYDSSYFCIKVNTVFSCKFSILRETLRQFQRSRLYVYYLYYNIFFPLLFKGVVHFLFWGPSKDIQIGGKAKLKQYIDEEWRRTEFCF